MNGTSQESADGVTEHPERVGAAGKAGGDFSPGAIDRLARDLMRPELQDLLDRGRGYED